MKAKIPVPPIRNKQITILDQEMYHLFDFYLVHSYKIVSPVNTLNCTFIGYDPGSAKMGLTFLLPEQWTSIALEIRSKEKYISSSSKIAMIEKLIDHFCSGLVPPTENKFAVIEGSSYGDKFGQVSLAETRTSAVMAIMKYVSIEKTVILPPQSIRKLTFGVGTARGENVYNNLFPNCAASIACAIAGTYLMKGGHSD